eukprot:4049758-Alexandrium_andersonii.AAC.1
MGHPWSIWDKNWRATVVAIIAPAGRGRENLQDLQAKRPVLQQPATTCDSACHMSHGHGPRRTAEPG